jgi:hypothetical protein
MAVAAAADPLICSVESGWDCSAEDGPDVRPPSMLCICCASAMMRSMGPPGTKRVTINTMIVMPRKVGIIKRMRRMKYAVIVYI